jgi:recX family
MALEIFDHSDFENKKIKNSSKEATFKDGFFIITDIKQAVKNQNRANIFVNGKYRFSLDIFQLTQLNIKVGSKFTKTEIENLEQQSEFGKLYALALNYCLMRPRSKKEISDYLWKKTLNRKLKNRKTGEFYEKKGVSKISVEQVLNRLIEKKYIDDEKFAKFWVENRNQRKGSSIKKLKSELFSKGVSSDIIEQVLSESNRNDEDEIQKIIAKKAKKYTDEQKLIAYLARQGFSFDEIKKVISKE